MATKLQPIICGVCNKSWNRSDEQANPNDPHQVAMMFGRGIDEGYVCETCNMFICKLCFLKASRQCFSCGNKHCSKIWVKELDEVEKEISRAFNTHIWVHVATGIISMIGIGFYSSHINQNISIGKGISISIVAVFLMLGLISPMRGVSPLDKKNAALLGGFYGGIWGAGVGAIAGWGGILTGGAFDFGLVPWIIGLTVFSSICMGFSFSTPARMAK